MTIKYTPDHECLLFNATATTDIYTPPLPHALPISYVPPAHAAVGTELFAVVRDKRVAMTVTTLPFVPNRYYRG